MRILLHGGVTTGLRYRCGGVTHEAVASGQVVLAAGVIGGSHLMLLSGIGPAGRLRDHGVEPVADAPAVANGLRGHPCA
jgi:choline dehydrogenase